MNNSQLDKIKSDLSNDDLYMALKEDEATDEEILESIQIHLARIQDLIEDDNETFDLSDKEREELEEKERILMNTIYLLTRKKELESSNKSVKKDKKVRLREELNNIEEKLDALEYKIKTDNTASVDELETELLTLEAARGRVTNAINGIIGLPLESEAEVLESQIAIVLRRFRELMRTSNIDNDTLLELSSSIESRIVDSNGDIEKLKQILKDINENVKFLEEIEESSSSEKTKTTKKTKRTKRSDNSHSKLPKLVPRPPNFPPPPRLTTSGELYDK